MSLSSHRAECIRVLERLVGPGGVQHWLTLRQPALGDETGARLLERDPGRLLRHLRLLDDQLDGDEIEDVPTRGPAARRSERGTSRINALLDELAVERRAR